MHRGLPRPEATGREEGCLKQALPAPEPFGHRSLGAVAATPAPKGGSRSRCPPPRHGPGLRAAPSPPRRTAHARGPPCAAGEVIKVSEAAREAPPRRSVARQAPPPAHLAQWERALPAGAARGLVGGRQLAGVFGPPHRPQPMAARRRGSQSEPAAALRPGAAARGRRRAV